MRPNFALLALLAATAFAQDDKTSRRDDILAALDLPATAQSLRDKGVDKTEVKEAMKAAKGKKLKAKETRDLMKDSDAAVDEHGPVDNFGAFVKGKLDSGLRGRDLAAAIKAEHQARGKGKGHGKKGAAAKDKEHGAKEKPKKEKEEGCGEEEEEGEKGSGKEKPEKPEKEHGSGKGKGGGQGKGKDK